MHLAFGELIPDCTKCEGEPVLRAQYGCDAPTKVPVLTVSPSTALYRCPGRLTEHRPDIRAAFFYCRSYEEQAVLPWHGGLDEQAAGFLHLLRAYFGERKYVKDQPQKKKEDMARKIQDIRMRASMEKRHG